MTCFISIAFFLTGTFSQAKSNLLATQTRHQVRHYIEAIHQRNEADLNLWALAEISRNQSNIQNYINTYIKKQDYSNPAFAIFQDTTLKYTECLKKLTFKTESPLLLVIYLLAEPDQKTQKKVVEKFTHQIGYPHSPKVNYAALVHAILQKKKITPDILSARSFQPLHFFLFYSKPLMQANTFSSQYLHTAVEHWTFAGTTSLRQSLRLTTLFRIFYTQDQYSKTKQFYYSLIENKLFPNSNEKLNILRALDYAMYRLGYYNHSLDIINKKSLPLAKYLKQSKTALKIQIAEGAYYYYIGDIKKSKQIYLELQNKISTNNTDISTSRLLNNLAIDYWKSGEFDQYLNLQFKALKKAKKEGIYEVQQEALRNLFTHYRVNNDFSSASEYLERAKKLAQRQKSNEDLAQLIYYEGQLYRDSKSDFNRAIVSFNRALNLISFENNYRSYQNILLTKAHLLEKQQDYEQAKDVYQKVLNNAKRRDDQRNALYASFNRANTYLELSQTDSAKVLLDSLHTQNLDALDFYQLVKARTVQARYLKKTGQSVKGSELIQPVIQQIVKRSRSSGDMERGFWQIQPEYLDAFELYTNLLIDNGRPLKAVEVLDRFKTINDVALYQNPLVRSKILNEKELSEYKRLTDKLDDLRRQLLAAKTESKNKIKQQIDELSSQKNRLDRKINAHENSQPVSVRNIQHRMDAHQRVLHITELNDTYYLAIISRTSVHFKKIPVTPKLRSQFKKSVAQIAHGKPDLTELYTFTQLLGLDKLPAYVHELTIIPDSYLYQLPIDVLPLSAPDSPNSYGEAHYLIERFETNYMTSLKDFNKPARKTHFKYGFAGYGVSHFDDDRKTLIALPQATTEIKAITRQLTALKNKRTFLNKDATEQTFRQTASKARILHLATHSKVDNQNPMFSSIYLRRSPTTKNKKDFPGRIFAYELFDLHLSNELVMLNSCESGSGSYIQGTGVVGISRALRYAGAESLVLNLWAVNDMMASHFAVQFYKQINKGKSKAEALRDAKLYFLKNKNANPHYWGSYMLLGNKEAIIQPYQHTNKVVAVSFMLFFFSMSLASSLIEIRKRRKLRN